MNFKKKNKSKNLREKSKKKKKKILLKVYIPFLMVEKWFLAVLKVKYFYYCQFKA